MGKVIITGVTGQDGSYMTDFLLKNTDHEIYGGVRRLSVSNHKNIDHVENPRFKIIDLDVTDPWNVSELIKTIQPDYFINFAANSFVGTSWEMPVNHFQTNAMGVLYQLEAIRLLCPKCRYYNAGSSEEFGDVAYSPQNERHPLRPRSPYGASKASARHLVKVCRESYNLYAVQGWLFNHESERRGVEFVTRKITKGLSEIHRGVTDKPLELGNLNAQRDWSHAEDFMRGVWLMLNQPSESAPKEYVLSSNETHTIKDFVNSCFKVIGVEGDWVGEGLEEQFVGTNGKIWVKINPKFYRPADVELLRGDFTKALMELGWKPEISFENLVERMMKNDL